MKQNIKKVWLILSMLICLAAVSGCAAASDTDKELDPSVVMTMQQGRTAVSGPVQQPDGRAAGSVYYPERRE